MENKDLKQVYDSMHSQGSSSWFGQGEEERELILKMGEPWSGLSVLEIGCGEGNLVPYFLDHGVFYHGIDYSEAPILNAREKFDKYFPEICFECKDYRNVSPKTQRIVMQGVLEHLDDPFTELKWMMDNLLTEKGDVITSSPCFLNPRGIVWMTLDMLGAVMSKTDLHFLGLEDFHNFCEQNGHGIECYTCDDSWGNGEEMINDLRQRIPLALKDGNLPVYPQKIDKFLDWLISGGVPVSGRGATAVYRISK